MSSSRSSSRILRRRERRAAEKLLDNSAVRDELTDDQANKILEWGLDRIEKAVGKTARLPDDDAEAAVEPTVTAVTRVMLAANRLLAHFAADNGLVEAESTLAHFVNNLKAVQELPDDAYDRLALLATLTDTNEIFNSIMQILSPGSEALDEGSEDNSETSTALVPVDESDDSDLIDHIS